MKAMLILDCDNAAFGETREDAQFEVSRIVHIIGESLYNTPGYGRTWETLRDANGNNVGRFCLKAEGDPGYQDLVRGIKYKD